MSILGKVRQFKELRRLKATAIRSPSPATIGTLAERFIALGRNEDAYIAAQKGLILFPTSERLHAVSTFAKKQRLQAQITRLRRDLAAHPNPAVFSQLAEIYRELEEYDKALDICESCLERFPLNENPYLIIGEVRLARFFQDLIAHDGLEAELQLRRVMKLNSQNVKAPLLLAQLYWVVGAVEPMLVLLETVLELAPGNKEIARFAREVRASPPPLPSFEDDDDGPQGALSISELVREAELRGVLVNPIEAFPARQTGSPAPHPSTGVYIDEDRLRQALGDLGRVPAIRNAVILDRGGDPFAEYADMESLTRKQFAELVTEVLSTAEDTSRRMDMGTFHWCTVEGAFGGISLTKVRSVALGIKFEQELRAEKARGLIEEFAARNLTPQEEVTGA